MSGTLFLREADSLMGPRGNPVMESFFSRGKVRATPVTKGENRDLFLEARDPTELKGVIAEVSRWAGLSLRYYHGQPRRGYLGERLHSGLGYRTPRETLGEALGGSHTRKGHR